MVTRVLVPVEDLLFENEIRDFLVHLNTLSLKIKVLHVNDVQDAVLQWPSSEYEKEGDALVRTFSENLRSYFPGVEVESVIREGVVKEEIAKEAELFEADLILLGAHGRKGLGKFLLGSTSKDLIPLAPCSVVLLRAMKSTIDSNLKQSTKQVAPKN